MPRTRQCQTTPTPALSFFPHRSILKTALAGAAFVTLHLVPAAAGAAEDAGTGDPRPNWHDIIGTHYRLDTENHLGAARGWPKWPTVGYHYDFTAITPDDIEPTVGRFSGEKRYYDFTGKYSRAMGQGWTFSDLAAVDSDMKDIILRRRRQNKKPRIRYHTIDYRSALRAAVDREIDLVWLTMAPNYRRKDKVEFLLAEKGAYYKDAIYEMVKYTHTGEFAQKPIDIYWELGNEVNSSNRFSIRDYAPGQHLRGDRRNGRDYVEYCFAPAVEALRTASREILGDPDAAHVLMGDVSGIMKEVNQEFLDYILDLEIRGEHAPSLAGKKPYELVDAVAVHYTNGHQDLIEEIYDKWVASGKTGGLWTTEELGGRGRGDYLVVAVAMRWLDFWTRHPWHGPETGRVIFWGDERKHPECATQGIGGLQLLGPFLQDYPLVNAKNASVHIETGADVEWYALKAEVSDRESRYVVLMKPYVEAQSAVRYIAVTPPADPAALDVDVSILDAHEKTRSVDIKTRRQDNGWRLDFETYELRPTEEVLVRITARSDG